LVLRVATTKFVEAKQDAYKFHFQLDTAGEILKYTLDLKLVDTV